MKAPSKGIVVEPDDRGASWDSLTAVMSAEHRDIMGQPALAVAYKLIVSHSFPVLTLVPSSPHPLSGEFKGGPGGNVGAQHRNDQARNAD